LLGNGVEVFASHSPASGLLHTLEAYGSGGRQLQRVEYEFDVLGNLVRRADSSAGNDLVEDFHYDELNRLFRVELTSPSNGLSIPTETLALNYDRAGNITYKSDVGAYRYGEGGAGPHAVTTAGGKNYAYDENGNQVSGAGRTISYSVFDKAVSIEKDGHSTRFSYGIAHRRIQREDVNSGGGITRVSYARDLEFVEDEQGVYFRRHLAGVAVQKVFPDTGTTATRYAVRDHLGSVHNVTDATGEAESAVWMKFSVFGQQRAVNGLGLPGQAERQALRALGNRGFTGHEHADSVGLIHMNGRIYDPLLGRFLQADPVLPSPGSTQALNRYSYALNNPLGFTDPSGYFLDRLFKRWGRLIAAVVLSVILPGSNGILANFFNVSGAYTQAAITGFVAGAIVSGNLKGAVIGALTAIAVAGITEAANPAVKAKGTAVGAGTTPSEATYSHLKGANSQVEGLYRISVTREAQFSYEPLVVDNLANGDVLFVDGMLNDFSAAMRNGAAHLQQAGLIDDSCVLYFNPTENVFADLVEAGRDILGAHTGLTHSELATGLAGVLDQASRNGVSGLRVVGHSQGGAIAASALRYADKARLNLSSLSGGGVALHGAPVNAWMARTRLADRWGLEVVSRHQFGDAVHVFGGLNISNPLEIPVALLRAPALFSSDWSVSPHSLPCAGSLSYVCRF
jgi:RHS repeat-associated protein